jgi:hypothetical protein
MEVFLYCTTVGGGGDYYYFDGFSAIEVLLYCTAVGGGMIINILADFLQWKYWCTVRRWEWGGR